jgi:hypothetical protein
MDVPTVEQAGSATVWFTSQAGIVSAVLAIISIALACGLVWAVLTCRKALKDANTAWVTAMDKMQLLWGARIDQMRGDVKEAFGQNAKVAEAMVAAMKGVELEIARLGGQYDARQSSRR